MKQLYHNYKDEGQKSIQGELCSFSFLPEKKSFFFQRYFPPPFLSKSTALKQVIPYEKCFFILNPIVFAHIRRFKTLFPPY